MVSNMGVANLAMQAGLFPSPADDSATARSKFAGVATNSGSSWFSLQLFYSRNFYDKVMASDAEELFAFVADWMTAYGDMYGAPAPEFGPQCPPGEAAQGLCPVLAAFGGNWAAYVDAMLNATSTNAYDYPDFTTTVVNAENRVPYLQDTCIHIQMSLAPNAQVRDGGDTNQGGYVGPGAGGGGGDDDALGNDVYTVPISTHYSVRNNGDVQFVFASDQAGSVVLTGEGPSANFTFAEFEPFTMFPGTDGTLTTLYDGDEVASLEPLSSSTVRSAPTTVAQVAAFTSAAAAVLSPLVPSMFAQVGSLGRAKILGDGALNDTAKAGGLAQLTAALNQVYQAPLFDGLSVCAQYPDPCGPGDLRFADGIYTDNPSLALDIGQYQKNNPQDVEDGTVVKVLVVNADPGPVPTYNAVLFLSYFNTAFNEGVPPGGYVWAPVHATPWRSPQIFEETLDEETFFALAEQIEGRNTTTTLLSGTTIDNSAFGTVAGQKVELFLININEDIPTDIITPGQILTYKEPLAALALDLALDEVLLERIEKFFDTTDGGDSGGGSSGTDSRAWSSAVFGSTVLAAWLVCSALRA